DELQQLLLADLALERGHDGGISVHDFGAGVEDGLAKVVLIRHRHCAVRKQDGLAVEARERWTLARPVAGDAAKLLVKLGPRRGQRFALDAAAQPAPAL